jgi:O-antigen ligase
LAKLGELKGIIIICVLAGLLIIFINPIIDLLTAMGSNLAVRLTSMFVEGETSGRDIIYKNVLDIIKQSPIVGVYYIVPSGPGVGMYPHNYFLEVFMATGFLGGTPFMILIFISLVKINTNKNEACFKLDNYFVFADSCLWNVFHRSL